MQVIGLIALKDPAAFEEYRQQVAATVECYGGRVGRRGRRLDVFWNELECGDFQACVELDFPSADAARQWAGSAEYGALLPVRSRAMKLTLFMVES